MTTISSIDDIFSLYESKGAEAYGERVTSLEHSLQCAHLAQKAGADDELVIASLLHDIGHLVADVQGNERFNMEVDDDDHEAVGARLLSPLFGPKVSQPVSLHVTAKRWRCTVEPLYHDGLSDTSKATLKAQGGLMNDEERRRFEQHPGFQRALDLRGWDDLAKEMEVDCPPLESYRDLMIRLVRS
ncbi:MAG: HD domain-containing protein [Acidimicrobiaceae bacterium]|jgi:phosphonate degradation associated HDIG domain protein